MGKDWLVGLGFGIGALAALGYLWYKFVNVEVTFEKEDDDDDDIWGFELPSEAAESIAIAYLKRQLVWMEEDREELIKDITAVRRAVWWMTRDFSYDDEK